MRKRVQTTESVSYWKSMVDVITTLMMVILLVLMYFVLNFLINKDVNPYPEDDLHGYYDVDHNDWDGGEVTPTPTSTPTPTVIPDDYDSAGGGGADSDGEYDEQGVEGTGYDRAAIYAVLIDTETNQVIEVPNIFFELYNNHGIKQTLTTHYPDPISYNQFETTEGGWFYLPEKIEEGSYYFRQLTEIPGYDFTADTEFLVEEPHEWNSPLVVNILVGASKNNIQVQINDAETDIGLSGVTFNVVANGDVITPDGTIRYTNGMVVDTIECDETGYGLSDELYLGNYTLVPTELPFGYAAPELESRTIELPRRTEAGGYAPLTVLESQRSTVRMKITDELAPEINVASVSFNLTCNEYPDAQVTVVTNVDGEIIITGLHKNATYTLHEAEVPRGYIYNDEIYTFTVDNLGLINEVPVYTLDLSYRMIRTEISTVDRVLNSHLLGYNVTLLDQNGKVITSWVSDGKSFDIEGLTPGVYTLRIDDENIETIINVENSKEIQKFSIEVMTRRGYMVIAGIGAVILLILAIAIMIVVPRISKKKKAKDNKDK